MTRAESGSALVESFLLGILLLIPLVWALGVLAELQKTALATAAAAREAGFEAARSEDGAAADAAVQAVTAQAFTDHGLQARDARVRWSAQPGFPRGGTIEVLVRAPVTVFQAPLIGRVSGPAIWVQARHVARIDPYRSRR